MGRAAAGSWWKEKTPPAAKFIDGQIICSDAALLLGRLRPNCADIVFLDPPFNLGKPYGARSRRADRVQEHEYFAYLALVISRAISVLRPGGAAFLYHLPKWAARFAAVFEEQLDFRHWIAISMKNGFVRGNRLYPAHYALLYYTKGSPRQFARPKIPPQRCRHCQEFVKDYGGYVEYVRNGVNLSDIWEDVSPVRHKKYKTRNSNELPLVITERVVGIAGRVGGLFVDPFAGSGTSLIAARQARMCFIGGDIDRENCSLMARRLRLQD
jgi:site-specific DNA-methyltransferase (adenine-specific)